MAAKKFDPIITVEDDKLIIPEVGAWGEKKYRLVGSYCEIFTSGMRYKWGSLIYIDLFAGAGFAKIKRTNKIVMSSALIALSITNQFKKYVFCEQDSEKLAALRERVERYFPNANVELY